MLCDLIVTSGVFALSSPRTGFLCYKTALVRKRTTSSGRQSKRESVRRHIVPFLSCYFLKLLAVAVRIKGLGVFPTPLFYVRAS